MSLMLCQWRGGNKRRKSDWEAGVGELIERCNDGLLSGASAEEAEEEDEAAEYDAAPVSAGRAAEAGKASSRPLSPPWCRLRRNPCCSSTTVLVLAVPTALATLAKDDRDSDSSA